MCKLILGRGWDSSVPISGQHWDCVGTAVIGWDPNVGVPISSQLFKSQHRPNIVTQACPNVGHNIVPMLSQQFLLPG